MEYIITITTKIYNTKIMKNYHRLLMNLTVITTRNDRNTDQRDIKSRERANIQWADEQLA
jgi:hypothetical protein